MLLSGGTKLPYDQLHVNKKHTTLAFPPWSPSRVLRKLNDV